MMQGALGFLLGVLSVGVGPFVSLPYLWAALFPFIFLFSPLFRVAAATGAGLTFDLMSGHPFGLATLFFVGLGWYAGQVRLFPSMFFPAAGVLLVVAGILWVSRIGMLLLTQGVAVWDAAVRSFAVGEFFWFVLAGLGGALIGDRLQYRFRPNERI